jgi:peroxiredoxin Q/BCP
LLLADPDHKAIGPYGVWGEKLNYGRTYQGLIRSTFLIGPDGTITRIWPNIRAKGHVDRVVKALG